MKEYYDFISIKNIKDINNLFNSENQETIKKDFKNISFKSITTNPSYQSILTIDSNSEIGDIEFPRGIIVMWSGDLSKIPVGWALCDGQNNTPDLRGRFIVGVNKAGVGAGLNTFFSEYNPNSTGGSERVTLSIEEMPQHNHVIKGEYGGSGDKWAPDLREITTDNFKDAKEAELNSMSLSGNNKSHENRPPYYALAYIMKIE